MGTGQLPLRLASAAQAAGAMRRLAHARIAQIGPLHPNLVSREADPLLLQARFGSWVVPLALAEVRRRVAALDPGYAPGGGGGSPVQVLVSVSDVPLGRALAVQSGSGPKISREHRVDLIAIDCWNDVLPEFVVTPCMGFAFDGYRIACERDLLVAVALLAGEAISGGPGFVGDFYSLNEGKRPRRFRLLLGRLCHPTLFDGPSRDRATVPPGTIHGNGTVLSCRPVLPRGQGTLVQLHGRDLDRLHLRRCRIASTRFTRSHGGPCAHRGSTLEASGRRRRGITMRYSPRMD